VNLTCDALGFGVHQSAGVEGSGVGDK